MPCAPQGQWRPADSGACAVYVMKIATGQIEETYEPPRDPKAVHAAAGRRASKAAKAPQSASQTPERRRQVAAAQGLG